VPYAAIRSWPEERISTPPGTRMTVSSSITQLFPAGPKLNSSVPASLPCCKIRNLPLSGVKPESEAGLGEGSNRFAAPGKSKPTTANGTHHGRRRAFMVSPVARRVLRPDSSGVWQKERALEFARRRLPDRLRPRRGNPPAHKKASAPPAGFGSSLHRGREGDCS